MEIIQNKQKRAQQSLFVLILLLLLSFVYVAPLQAQSSHLIVGDWSLNYTASLNAISTEDKAKYDAISNLGQSKIENFYANRQFNFYDDGTYQIQFTNGTTSQGTWENSNNDDITLTKTNGEIDFTCSVIQSNNYLVLHLHESTQNDAFFKSFFLIANK